jgi:Zn-dependent protease with chaperone function
LVIFLVLQPLPYHVALRDYLKVHERAAWEKYASPEALDKHADAVRFELLKSTYPIDRKSWPEWYAAAEGAAAKLGLNVPIVLRQAHQREGLNASLASLRHEAHLVLHGPVATKLNEAEFRALLGHELSHLLLWRGDEELFIAQQVLAALAAAPQADPAFPASARLFALYSEIFCDRGAVAVAGEMNTVVSMLIKIATGQAEASSAGYLRQAEEMFRDRDREPASNREIHSQPQALASHDKGSQSSHDSHPDTYLRLWALKRWSEGDADGDAKIAQAIERPPTLNGLDLLGRQRVAGLTRRLLNSLLGPGWFHTPAILAHARLYFEDFSPPAHSYEDITLAGDLQTRDAVLRDYYCFLMLDFVTADRELRTPALAAALQLAERLGFKDRFAQLALDELRMRKKQFEKIDQEKAAILQKQLGGPATEH